MKHLSLVFLFSINIFAQSIRTSNSEINRALESITPEYIKAHTLYLSDDMLEGRGTGSRGEKIAAKYIAAQFQAIGLEPGNSDGTYFQNIPIVGIESRISIPMIAVKADKSIEFNYLTDHITFSGQHEDKVSVDAEVVFVGYGIIAPQQNWDDYKDVDVSGKILLIMNDDPKSPTGDPKFFGGNARTYYGRWTYKYEIAAEKGAIGAIIIHTDSSAGYSWDVVQNSWSTEQFGFKDDPSQKFKMQSWLTETASSKLVEFAGYNLKDLMAGAESRKFMPVRLGINLSVTVKNKIREIYTQNVLGLLKGSDLNLSSEVVVHTAHYDHLGISLPVNGDSIYNGASDNALGVGMMLSIAKAFTELEKKPKRSILFIACAAEETGGLGSEYYAANPTFPLEKIAANFNTDGANFFGLAKDITFIGSECSTMGKAIEKVLKQQKIRLTPDKFPEQGSFYRSDQFSFAKVGIPAASVRGGSDYFDASLRAEDYVKYRRENYHQPTDTVAPWWNFNAVVQQAQLVFLCELEVANQIEIPEWNPNQEFQRLKK